ncbi:MAG: hypothetical protein QME52_03625 [Bacteroidota bacterium]|nr:hypothetical protein [Bacteroidota bacterium]
MYKQRICHRYSQAFKQKVVSEIESDKFTISEARAVYDILGKTHLLNKVIHIQMKDEKADTKLKKRTDTISLNAASETIDFTKENIQ